MTNFHPDLDLITEYTAGTLPLAHAACVGVHVGYCEHCKRMTNQLSELGAAMFEGLETTAVGDATLNKVLARLGEPPPLEYERPAPDSSTTPAILQRLMTGDFSDLEWQQFGSNLRISYLRTGDHNHEFALYHIKAGGRIPEHTHRGTEMTQVLEGSFSDVAGNYQQGDFIFRRPGDVHAPTAGQSQDCICLSVLDAPLKFTTWKFRWINPFLKLHMA